MADTAQTVEEIHQVRLLRRQLAGRKFVVAQDVAVVAAFVVDELRELGVADLLAVAGSRGTGELSPEAEAAVLKLDLPSAPGSLMAQIRAFEALLAGPPPVLVEAVEAFDADRSALILGPLFTHHEQVLGRRVFGARERAWRALEDKTVVDALWDAAGVKRAPSRVVPADAEALAAAAAELDRGHGTVWVADNRRGWHGGGDGLRWVRMPEDQAGAARFMADQADRVRIMPFLEGRPCSIHGWVIGGDVLSFNPVEAVVLRDPERAELRYGGVATNWLPAEEDTEQMRDVARAVGHHLRDAHGYRGVFTVDGVLTADGFRPTELNPRFGAGMNALARGTDLPLYFLNAATIEWPDLDWQPRELEAMVRDAAGRAPVAGGMLLLDAVPDGSTAVSVARTDGRWRIVGDGGDGDGGGDGAGTLEFGPAPSGGMLRARLDASGDGSPVAPMVAEVLQLGAEAFGLDLPRLEAAPEVRPAR